MALPSTYADRNCSLARALEIVGERWTLLIVRDAFFGIRKFGDFATQLGIPRAVLTNRLKLLVREEVLQHNDNGEYQLTAKGIELWPILRAMMAWGDAHYSPGGSKRIMRHEADGGLLDGDGRCAECGGIVPVPDTRVEPGPGHDAGNTNPDPVSAQLTKPRRLLEPLA